MGQKKVHDIRKFFYICVKFHELRNFFVRNFKNRESLLAHLSIFILRSIANCRKILIKFLVYFFAVNEKKISKKLIICSIDERVI